MSTRPSLAEPVARRRRPAGHAIVIAVIALGLGTLLNAQALLASAEALELGSAQRSIATGVMRPIAGFADLVGLDTPRNVIDDALGRAEVPREPIQAAPNPSPGDPAPSSTTTTTVAPAEPTGLATRPVTSADPLKVWLVADSFGELFGPALVNRGQDLGLIEADYDFRFITGLTRPDYFDWPAHAAARLPEVEPDVVVAMFGGNDGANLAVDGNVLEVGTPEWQAEYARRVGEMMDVLRGGAQHVYWVGMPIMKSDSFSEKVQMMNGLYEAEAEERPDVTYVDIWELFQDDTGAYSTYLPDGSGELVRMRAPDNAHFWWGGAYRLSDFLIDKLGEDWQLDA